MSTKIGVLDYGIGNVRSLIKALECLGAQVVFSSEPAQLTKAAGLVVPGVSSFGACMRALNRQGLDEFLREYLREGRKYLGICLGYQILFRRSAEDPEAEGLGVLPGEVVKFKVKLKVPHMGWNTVSIRPGSRMFAGIAEGSYFYFVHSYYPCPPEEITAAFTEYGVRFASAVEKDNIWACQFHPEKSSRNGLKLLNNFIRWCKA